MTVGEAWVPRSCTRCGWPDDQPFEFVSQHNTSAGVIVYTRCACGLLRVFLRDKTQGGARTVARATHLARETHTSRSWDTKTALEGTVDRFDAEVRPRPET